MVSVIKTASGLPLYVSPKAISDLKTNITTEKKDKENAIKLLEGAKVKYKEYAELYSSDDSVIEERLTSELNDLKMAAGATELKGKGVSIFVDDGTRELSEGESINMLLVHDQDILNLLNALNKAGAEAISVNGQRVINTTSISCSGYTIRINGMFFARPFEIKALGDPKKLSDALNNPEGFATILKLWGVICEVKMENDITIPKYTGDQSFKYLKKVEEGIIQ